MFRFRPRSWCCWAFCDGQILPLSQNTALFSLLGTTYGGDGKSNFALPDMQGNAPMHPGQGPGLSLHDLGETGGSDTVSLLETLRERFDTQPAHTPQLEEPEKFRELMMRVRAGLAAKASEMQQKTAQDTTLIDGSKMPLNLIPSGESNG